MKNYHVWPNVIMSYFTIGYLKQGVDLLNWVEIDEKSPLAWRLSPFDKGAAIVCYFKPGGFLNVKQIFGRQWSMSRWEKDRMQHVKEIEIEFGSGQEIYIFLKDHSDKRVWPHYEIDRSEPVFDLILQPLKENFWQL